MKVSHFQVAFWIACIFLLSVFANAQQGHATNLVCNPTPCVLPNVQVSEGGMPVTAGVIAVNPNNSNELIVATEDYNCTNAVGVDFSRNAGTSWKQTCVPTGDAGSPIAGYDLTGNAYAGGLGTDSGDGPYAVSVSSSANNGKTWGSGVSATSNEPNYFT